MPLYREGLLDYADSRDAAAGRRRTTRGRAWRPDSATWTLDGQSTLPLIEGPDAQATARSGVVFASFTASLFIVAHPDYVRSVRILPRGPGARRTDGRLAVAAGRRRAACRRARADVRARPAGRRAGRARVRAQPARAALAPPSRGRADAAGAVAAGIPRLAEVPAVAEGRDEPAQGGRQRRGAAPARGAGREAPARRARDDRDRRVLHGRLARQVPDRPARAARTISSGAGSPIRTPPSRRSSASRRRRSPGTAPSARRSALAMVRGALRHSDAHHAVAVTGIAGPAGGSARQARRHSSGSPGASGGAGRSRVHATGFRFRGGRDAVRRGSGPWRRSKGLLES